VTDYDWWDEWDDDGEESSVIVPFSGGLRREEWASLAEGFGLPPDFTLFVDLSKVNVSDLRANIFFDLTDALNFLFDIGVLGFSNLIVERDEQGNLFYRAYVPPETPIGRTRK